MFDYYPDLSQFSLEKLQHLFEITRLLPSQQLLQEDIEERFTCLAQHGIENLQQLQKALKARQDVQTFAQTTGLPVEYLTLLRREVNSYHPKPVLLKDFPGVNPDAVQKLAQMGIKNTKQLFEQVITPETRAELAAQTQIAESDILELTRLSDMARLKWVGPKFARLLIESEYDTAAKVINANYAELHEALIRTNEEKEIYQGRFGIEDMKSWVTVAIRDVPQVIQY
jgi:hypothetical protein